MLLALWSFSLLVLETMRDGAESSAAMTVASPERIEMFSVTGLRASYVETERTLTAQAQALREQGGRALDATTRRALFCRSLALYGAALNRAPFSAALLLNWANLRQLLGDTPCEEPRTSGDASATRALALAQEPLNPRVLYSGGLLALRDNARDQALDLFRRTIELSVRMDREREEVILSQMKGGGDVAKIVPARFPQLARWTALLEPRVQLERQLLRAGRAGVVADPVSPVLTELQLRALRESATSFARDEISERIYRNHLLALYERDVANEVRRELDAAYGAFLGRSGQVEESVRALRAYLKRRSELDGLQIISATIEGDTRVARSPLVEWGRNESLYLDDHYRTVGFFLPADQGLRIIEVNGRGSFRALDKDEIRIFGSNDNQEWTEMPRAIVMHRVALEDRRILAIEVESATFRYWKIHFGSAVRSRSFLGDLRAMVRAYGLSARGDRDDVMIASANIPGKVRDEGSQ